jgi:multiple sugar transport system substrate-binding protein
LPPRQSVVDSDAFRSLPQRAEIAEIASSGRMLPAGVARQRRVMGQIGEAITTVILGQRAAAQALPEAESHIHRMLLRESRFRAGLAAGG